MRISPKTLVSYWRRTSSSGNALDRPRLAVAGVVDQDAHGTLGVDDPLHGGAHRALVGDVERQRASPRRRRGRRSPRAARGRVDDVAVGQQPRAVAWPMPDEHPVMRTAVDGTGAVYAVSSASPAHWTRGQQNDVSRAGRLRCHHEQDVLADGVARTTLGSVMGLRAARRSPDAPLRTAARDRDVDAVAHARGAPRRRGSLRRGQRTATCRLGGNRLHGQLRDQRYRRTGEESAACKLTIDCTRGTGAAAGAARRAGRRRRRVTVLGPAPQMTTSPLAVERIDRCPCRARRRCGWARCRRRSCCCRRLPR